MVSDKFLSDLVWLTKNNKDGPLNQEYFTTFWVQDYHHVYVNAIYQSMVHICG